MRIVTFPLIERIEKVKNQNNNTIEIALLGIVLRLNLKITELIFAVSNYIGWICTLR